MSSILGVLLALAGGVFAGFSLYLLTLALAYAVCRYHTPPRLDAPRKRLAVLVPAHDEERLIGRCVGSLLAQSYPHELYRVIVIADNCVDQTAALATEAGAEVMVRDEPNARGKGQALRWAMDRVLAPPDPPDAVVVVDGDSIADRNLLSALELELTAGHAVVQADYTVLTEPGSPRTELIAAGFLLFHRVRFSGRAAIGMAASLAGNGMLFSAAMLEKHPWDAFTGVEDLEYSIRLRLAGIRPRFAAAALVSGPAPATSAGAVRQRLRWEGGRFNVVRTRLWELIRAAVIKRDASLADAALDLATPPLGLLCMGAGAGACLATMAVLAHIAPLWALAPWVIAVVATPMYVVIGLRSAGAPPSTFRAMLSAPIFLGWKFVTYLRLLRGFDILQWDRTDRQGEVGMPDAGRLDIAGVPIDPVDMAAAISKLRAAMGGQRLFQVSTINLDFMVRAQSDPEVRRIFRRSDLNLADGAPVVWLGRLSGAKIPCRVAGADLVPALLEEAARTGARVFFLGGEDGAALAAATRLAERYPSLVVAGTYEPPRAAIDDMNNAEILSRIAEAQPDLLLVALGHPKQERWIDLHREQLPVSVAIGVGCVLDLIAGRRRRAPRWMQEIGLEWAYRLAHEPRRLFARYFIDAAWLLPITARALRSRISTTHAVEPA